MTPAALAPQPQAVPTRRIRLLVATTITYKVVEAVVALVAGTVASSIALVGFGLDSIIEVSSAAAVAWQFSRKDPQRRERVARRMIGRSAGGGPTPAAGLVLAALAVREGRNAWRGDSCCASCSHK